MGRPHVCPYCKAVKSVSKGIRKTKTMGDRCIRLCKACGRKFTPKHQKPPHGEEIGAQEQKSEPTQVCEPDEGPDQADEPAEALKMLFPPPG